MKKIIKLYIVLLSLIILYGCSSNRKSKWIDDAFETIISGDYPRIKAISYWHEKWENKCSISDLRINSSPAALDAYQKGVANSIFITNEIIVSNKLKKPDSGIYISAFPYFGNTEDQVSVEAITYFEKLSGKHIVWAYFSNNWFTNIKFPEDEIKAIREAGKIPFVRLMARSNDENVCPDPQYTMENIISGIFDSELNQWAVAAAEDGKPILCEFGTEVNGNWFPWNGEYNGGETTDSYGNSTLADGPERFRDAYRHIIDLFRNNGADNMTWFFHVNYDSVPEEDWNNYINYYPGDNYIDWLGVSIYGAQKPFEEYTAFSEILYDIYEDLCSISSNKPLAILEFGVTE